MLPITETDSGKVLVKCFAGCSKETVISDLREQGLWPEPKKLPAKQVQAYQRKKSRYKMESALNHELNVQIQFAGWRVADQEAARERKFRFLRPDWRPLSNEPWDREILAVQSIRQVFMGLYD